MKFSAYTIEVLKQERFDLAFAHLESTFRENPSADIALEAAVLYTLASPEQMSNGFDALTLAAEKDPEIEEQPAFIAVRGLLLSYHSPEEALEDLNIAQDSQDAVVVVLTARGYVNAQQYPKAITLLEGIDAQTLPFFLKWRYHTTLAEAYWQNNMLSQAVVHNQEGLNMPLPEAYKIRFALNLADIYDEQNNSTAVVETLQPLTAALQKVGSLEQQLPWHVHLAQHLMNLNQLPEAWEAVQHAYTLEKQMGDTEYDVALIYGQVLLAHGKPLEAIPYFEEALDTCEDLSYCRHELGIAYVDADMLIEAEEILQQVIGDMDYPYAPEALADLADCHHRLGHFALAEQEALEALEQGAVLTSSMVLGGIAMEYYHLPDAYRHYERVIEHSAEGSREWTLAKQFLADILVQQGFREPALILEYAEDALRYTEPSDDMSLTLQGFVSRARDVLNNQDTRTLN